MAHRGGNSINVRLSWLAAVDSRLSFSPKCLVPARLCRRSRSFENLKDGKRGRGAQRWLSEIQIRPSAFSFVTISIGKRRKLIELPWCWATSEATAIRAAVLMS